MKEDIFVLGAILLLMFLFLGEPDVFDALIESTRKWLLK
jgi:hypothetical protein